MHVNFHYSAGIIISTSAFYLNKVFTGIEYSLFEFSLIIFCSFGADLDIIIDIIVGKMGKESGHRFYVTHSLYPGLILLVIGLIVAIFNGYHIYWICGISYLIHIMSDCLDGEVSLLFTEKRFGLSLLLTKKERRLFLGVGKAFDKEKERNPYFMDIRYFSNKFLVSVEILVSLVSFILLFLITPQFWYISILYFPMIGYHIYYYLKGIRIENLNLNVTEVD
jgi:hypothetical protein